MSKPESTAKPFTDAQLKRLGQMVEGYMSSHFHRYVDSLVVKKEIKRIAETKLNGRIEDRIRGACTSLMQHYSTFNDKIESNRVTTLETFQNVLQLAGVVTTLARRIEALEGIFADHPPLTVENQSAILAAARAPQEDRDLRNFVRREQYRLRKEAERRPKRTK